MAARVASKRIAKEAENPVEDELTQLARQRAGTVETAAADGEDKDVVEMELRSLSSATGRTLSASRQPVFDATFGTGDHWQTATEKTRLLLDEAPGGAPVDSEPPVDQDPVATRIARMSRADRANLLKVGSLVHVEVEEPEDEKMPKDKVVAEEVSEPNALSHLSHVVFVTPLRCSRAEFHRSRTEFDLHGSRR